MKSRQKSMKAFLAVLMLSAALAWTSAAAAAAAEPKRSYGAVDVIMYQTSW